MRERLRLPRGGAPLLVLGCVVVLVAFGFARGFWASNLHNGLLALAFTAVGAYVLAHRARHPLGRLFVATGVVEGVLFLGRQIGYAPSSTGDRWWAWLGVWPVPLALALTTLAVICFPDGRLPSRRWRGVIVAVALLAATLATLSALWPVAYPSAGALTAHPVHAEAPATVADLWSALAPPTYIAFQFLWIVALASRWARADPETRGQLRLILAAAAVSVVGLVVGLLALGTHVPGVLAAALVPIAAGWAVVHGRHLATYRALSWLSRTTGSSGDLSDDAARTTAEALRASGARLWMGGANRLVAVGVWPQTDDPIAPTTLDELSTSHDTIVRVLRRDERLIGALTVEGVHDADLPTGDRRLLDDLAGQAAWVLEHLTLARLVEAQRQSGHLVHLTPRERDVLELLARGLSNQAICDELFLSIKTVEPIVSAIFAKLDLHPDAAKNRRVLAALAYLRGQGETDTTAAR